MHANPRPNQAQRCTPPQPTAGVLRTGLVQAGMLVSVALLGACGGGAATTASNASVATPASSTVAASETPATVSSVLSIRLEALDNYAALALPAYFDASVSALDNTPANNPITNAGATLGRVLFYDKHLSVNDTTACASCHTQASGFSDVARFSTGFSGAAVTTAHAMRLGNVRYFRPGRMFWDRRAASLEAQASQPIVNNLEMGFDAAHGGIAAAVAKLQALPYYPDLFRAAFGDSTVTEERIDLALSQFERSIVSSASRWDSGYASTFNPMAPNRGLNANLPGLSAQENRGRAMFMGGIPGANCAACHVPPSFALTANSRSNGLDAGETTVFKSPSLKNVGLSGAFMHDGRFATLAQVVEHYNSGIQPGPALDNRLSGRGGAPARLNLSAADKGALVAFMHTLTDTALASDAKFSDPFKP